MRFYWNKISRYFQNLRCNCVYYICFIEPEVLCLRSDPGPFRSESIQSSGRDQYHTAESFVDVLGCFKLFFLFLAMLSSIPEHYYDQRKIVGTQACWEWKCNIENFFITDFSRSYSVHSKWVHSDWIWSKFSFSFNIVASSQNVFRVNLGLLKLRLIKLTRGSG